MILTLFFSGFSLIAVILFPHAFGYAMAWIGHFVFGLYARLSPPSHSVTRVFASEPTDKQTNKQMNKTTEKNKPATFKYPLWSYMGDWVMCYEVLTGKRPLDERRMRK